VSGSIYTHRKMVAHLAKRVACRALLYEYEYAHEAKYPAQLSTAMAAYQWLTDQGVKPEHVAMGCDSCGALMTFGILQGLRGEGRRLPAAVLVLSGWVNLAIASASYEENRDKDGFFTKARLEWLAANVLGEEGDPKDPLVSALYADLRGMPPMFLQYGSDESLVEEARALAERAKAAGVDVRIDVVPEMLHSFQMMAGRAPEADDAISRLAHWVRPRLGLR
jgi:acetyl esterase/lipase